MDGLPHAATSSLVVLLLAIPSEGHDFLGGGGREET